MTTIEKAGYLTGMYEQHGHSEYIGEKISQLEHAVQCATLAADAGGNDEMILAAFLHDVGHLCDAAGMVDTVRQMSSFGVADHDTLGANMLRSLGMSERVAKLVASHVDAKRYLTFRDPAYYNNLSEASKETLRFQGGPMSQKEATAFEEDPLFAEYIQLRRWDEMAKQTDQPLPETLDYFTTMIIRHLETQHHD